MTLKIIKYCRVTQVIGPELLTRRPGFLTLREFVMLRLHLLGYERIAGSFGMRKKAGHNVLTPSKKSCGTTILWRND